MATKKCKKCNGLGHTSEKHEDQKKEGVFRLSKCPECKGSGFELPPAPTPKKAENQPATDEAK